MEGQTTLFDVTIVGGGPAGLFGALQAGLQGMNAKIIESHDYLGGQLTTLYPDRFIYDVPGFPAVLARTLVGELIRQALNYHPTIALGETVRSLRRLDDETIEVQTTGATHLTRTVLIAVGGGAFTPTQLAEGACQAYEGRGLEYFLMDISDYRRKRVLVVGGGDAAIDASLLLRRVTDQVTLIHRGERFRVPDDRVARLQQSGVNTRLQCVLTALHGRDRVESMTLLDSQTQTAEVHPVDAVLVQVGFASTLGPLHEWDLAMDAGGLTVTTRMETSMPGVYAAGDIASYAGKLKLISTAFGEVAIAVNQAYAFVHPGDRAERGHSTSIVPRQRAATRSRPALPDRPDAGTTHIHETRGADGA